MIQGVFQGMNRKINRRMSPFVANLLRTFHEFEKNCRRSPRPLKTIRLICIYSKQTRNLLGLMFQVLLPSEYT